MAVWTGTLDRENRTNKERMMEFCGISQNGRSKTDELCEVEKYGRLTVRRSPCRFSCWDMVPRDARVEYPLWFMTCHAIDPPIFYIAARHLSVIARVTGVWTSRLCIKSFLRACKWPLDQFIRPQDVISKNYARNKSEMIPLFHLYNLNVWFVQIIKFFKS
jgi:hypothetical protein